MVAVSTQAVYVVMDHMDAPPGGQYVNDSQPPSTVPIPGLWPTRTIAWGAVNGTGLAEVEINKAPNSVGILDYRQAVLANTVMILRYDNNGAGMNVDLRNMGYLGLVGVEVEGQFTIGYSILDGATTLLSDTAAWSLTTGTYPELVDYFGYQPTWGSVDTIEFTFTPMIAGSDISIDGVVPEPSSALVIAGLLGLGAVVRRFTK